MSDETQQKISQLIENAQNIVILQADNPDGDSLASALAIEQILADMGKVPYLYCAIDMPAHLKHMPGWDRVSRELPLRFDESIVVDTSSDGLFELLNNSGHKGWVTSKPSIVLDHHATEATITWATIMCIEPVVSTGELIYELALQLHWPLAPSSCEFLAMSILSDSLGLTTDATSARSIHIIGELVERGVNIANLENKRREMNRKSPDILRYKGELIQRITYSTDGRIATVVIPWEEIEMYSQEYNPSVLVLDEMRMVEGVDLAIAFKIYKDGRYTAKLRSNYGKPVAREVAEHFGGGGHAYASGFKIIDKRPFDEVKAECLRLASQLLDELEETDATV